MALNKAHTSVWVKVLIIILIVAFVSLFMYQGLAGIALLFQQNTQSATSNVDPVTEINQKNQSTVDYLKGKLDSSPTSYTAAVNLANGYFDWAQELSTPATGQSQVATPAMAAAFEKWTSAKSAYDAATKLTKTMDPSVQTDRSYAALYSNDTTGAITIVKAVIDKAPNFAQAWVHLGIYYEAANQTPLAVPAYQKYLQLDPSGQNADYVKGRLKALGIATTGAPSTPATSGAATKTP